MAEGERAVANLDTLHRRLRPCFARRKPFEQARKYMCGLMSDLPRKNGWTIAEHVGDRTPDRTQRLLNQAVWDHDRVQGVVRRFVVEQVGDQPLRVGRWTSPVRRSRASNAEIGRASCRERV